jgi:tellurite methyltransferase
VPAPAPPSPFLLQQRQRLRAAARLGPVVDLACGRGRHALALAGRGIPVVGLDRSRAFLAELRAAARERGLALEAACGDFEAGHGLPLAPGRCGALLVFRYLHRPLAPAIADALAPGGLLLYETFTIHQRDRPEGPVNPDFLLLPGELPALFLGLEVLESWEGESESRPALALARLVARRPARDAATAAAG